MLGRLHHRRAAAALLREVERRHPADDHWYLALLATDPTRQGRGLGTALLGPILGRCDAEGQPAYTETQKEGNVAWYARSGFALIDEVHVRGAPTIWRLWRDPKPTADGERPARRDDGRGTPTLGRNRGQGVGGAGAAAADNGPL